MKASEAVDITLQVLASLSRRAPTQAAAIIAAHERVEPRHLATRLGVRVESLRKARYRGRLNTRRRLAQARIDQPAIW